MIELKGLSQDVLKNTSDIENYNREFKDLQVQLKDMTEVKFNGVSLFAQYTTKDGGTEGVFDNIARDNTLSIFVSAEGSQGPKVSIGKAMMLSALTIDAGTLKSSVYSVGTTGGTSGNVITFAAESSSTAINLADVSVAVFTQALRISPPCVLIMVRPCRDFALRLIISQQPRQIWKPQMVVLSMLILPAKVRN